MIKIIYLQDYKDKRRKDTEYVSNNVAFGLQEQGIAVPYTDFVERLFESPEDKMMRPMSRAERKARKKATYRIK